MPSSLLGQPPEGRAPLAGLCMATEAPCQSLKQIISGWFLLSLLSVIIAWSLSFLSAPARRFSRSAQHCSSRLGSSLFTQRKALLFTRGHSHASLRICLLSTPTGALHAVHSTALHDCEAVSLRNAKRCSSRTAYTVAVLKALHGREAASSRVVAATHRCANPILTLILTCNYDEVIMRIES